MAFCNQWPYFEARLDAMMCVIFLRPTLFIQICAYAHIWARRQVGERQEKLVLHYLALPCLPLGIVVLTCKFGFICMNIWSNYGICQQVGMYGRNFVKTRPKPACGQQGLVGRIVRPGCSSSRYILGSSQHLASCLQRSTRIGFCRSKCSEHSESHFFWTSQKWWIENIQQTCSRKWQPLFVIHRGSQMTGGRGAGRE